MLLLLGCTASFAATTYRWVDASGVVHYSDQPQPGAEKIDLPTAQTYRAPPSPAVPVNAPAAAPPAAYRSCRIAQPASEQTLFEQEAVTVSVALDPGRRVGDQVSLTFDGMTLTPISPDSLDFRISPIDRGAHTVSAVVYDANGQAVCSVPSVTFYVRQPSVLAPNSPLHK
jgi:hypothetical protein